MFIEPFLNLCFIGISIGLLQWSYFGYRNVCHNEMFFKCCLLIEYSDIRISKVPFLNFFLQRYSKSIP